MNNYLYCNTRTESYGVFHVYRRIDPGGKNVTTRFLCVPVTVTHGSTAVPMI